MRDPKGSGKSLFLYLNIELNWSLIYDLFFIRRAEPRRLRSNRRDERVPGETTLSTASASGGVYCEAGLPIANLFSILTAGKYSFNMCRQERQYFFASSSSPLSNFISAM